MKLNLVLALSTVGLAIVVGHLSWRLEHERESARTSRVEAAAELRARVADLEQERRSLKSELQSMLGSTGRSAVGESGSIAASRGLTGAGGIAEGRLIKSVGPVRPEREIAQEHQLTAARMRYGMLLHELGLSEQEIETLLPVLSEFDRTAMRASGIPPGLGLIGLQGDHELAGRRASVAAVIGEERADDFERVMKTIPTRGELSMARSQLEAMGDPMTEQQQKKLLAVMSERSPRHTPPTPTPVDRDQMLKSLRETRKEANQRLLAEAATVLTPRQVQRLAESQAMNEAMMSSFSSATNSGAAGSAP